MLHAGVNRILDLAHYDNPVKGLFAAVQKEGYPDSNPSVCGNHLVMEFEIV